MGNFEIRDGVLVRYHGCGGDVTVPEGIHTIGEWAFGGCAGLRSVTIPEGVAAIDRYAFEMCGILTSVTLPESLRIIGSYAFAWCEALASIHFPENIVDIWDHAFEGCGRLTSVELPSGIGRVSESLFERCYNLKKVTIKEGVSQIGWSAFYGCRALTEITIPERVRCIGPHAFGMCSALKEITIPEGILDLMHHAFEGCSALAAVNLPDSFENIDPGAFKGCRKLAHGTDFVIVRGILFDYVGTANDVVIPEGVTTISQDAFSGITGPLSVTIPESTEIIEDGAFYGCSNLVSLTIPDSVTDIGKEAFQRCGPVQSVQASTKVLERTDSAELWHGAAMSMPIGELCSFLKQNPKRVKVLAEARILASGDPAARAYFAEADRLEEARILAKGDPAAKACFEKAGRLEEYERIRAMDGETLLERAKENPQDVTLWYTAAFRASAEQLISAVQYGGRNMRGVLKSILLAKEGLAAARYHEKHGRLEEYAAFHHTEADVLRDTILSDFALDAAGRRSWTLAGKRYTACLNRNAGVTLVDESGKALKGLPDRGAEPDAYEAAKQELAALKRAVSGNVRQRTKRLQRDFLEGRARTAENWKRSYLQNPLPRQQAKLLVWQQGTGTFTLNAEGLPVDWTGTGVELTEEPILLAHPMELKPETIKAWQDYFLANRLTQPFPQIWEPVIDPDTITPNRYAWLLIRPHLLRGKHIHGIYGVEEEQLRLRDCTAEAHQAWGGNWTGDGCYIEKFICGAVTRYVNHIADYLDGCTVEARLLNDDISALQWLDRYTPAEIDTFLTKVVRAGDCPNAAAALLNYQNQRKTQKAPFQKYRFRW